MDTKVSTVEVINRTQKTNIPGLIWRGFRGEADFPQMLAVIHGCSAIDGIERAEQMEDIVNNYAHLHHCDPYQDMLLAEVNGKVVGYTRCWWEVEGNGTWIGFEFGYVLPELRRKGIGSTLLHFTEGRLQEIARKLKARAELPAETTCFITSEVHDSEIDRRHLIERADYQAVRYSFEMVRPDLENIPDLKLPSGVEVRPVKPEQLHQIWEASNEAFRDHWGYIPDPWEEYERLVNDPDHDPSLWKVAWSGDQVVGMVLSFIDKDQNEKFGRQRGYTENICVRKPWRKHGVARALIAMGLKALKERDMHEAGLGVDAENISGALNLYKFMGFQVTKRMTIYRKKIDV